MSKKKKIILFSILGTIATAILVTAIVIILIVTNSRPVEYSDEKLTNGSDIIEIPTFPIIETNVDSNITNSKISPKDYPTNDVVAMVLGKVLKEEEFSVTTTGKSTASTILGNVEIKISNSRIVIGTEAMITCISAGMVSNGSQRYFNDNGIYIRNSSKVNDDATAEFSDDAEISKLTESEYMAKYGWMPHKAFGYVINNNTYLNDPTMIENSDNTYTINIDLDPNSDAVFYYKREIATNANATEEPVFKKINIIMTINEDFRIKEIKFNETYVIKAYGLFATETTTEITDTYNYDNVSFNEEYYNYFKNHINN